MSKACVVAVILWIGVTLYSVFGGAGFGAGRWDLVAGRGERGERARALIDHSLAPVWEANHVWLIFVLVILWTAFPPAFSAVMTTLYIPLTLAALGIVLRGAGFAFRHALPGPVYRPATRVFWRVTLGTALARDLLAADAVLHGHRRRRDRLRRGAGRRER